MYLANIKPNQFYTIKMSRVWATCNIILAVFALTISGSKLAVDYHTISTESKEAKVVTTPVVTPPPPPVVKMNAEVFYACLSAAKNKEGVKAEEIIACKEASTIDLVPVEDKDKYTLSKRPVVFY